MTTTHPTLGEARLPRNPLLSEVLSLVSKQKTKAKKIETLKQYESLHLKSFLPLSFVLILIPIPHSKEGFLVI